MAFFTSSYSSSSINQPKMRQEGFHLPSPSPSNGHPPSPPSATSASAFDMFIPQHSSHHSSNSPTSANGTGNNHSPHSANANAHFPGLSLPDAFSRSGGAMDFGDELASLMASSPATSNERSTHTPPYDHHSQGTTAASASSADNGSGSAYRPTHNIFDISAPPSAHYSAGAHAFSLPHTSHRPELPPMSQPSSVHTSHLHHPYDHHDYHQPPQQHHPLGRDGFPAHFNSTIPPLSNHHDPPIPPEHQHQGFAHPSSAYNNQVYSPASSGGPARETPSPPGAAGTSSTAARSSTSQRRSGSRSRSRARGSSVSATGAGSSSGAGPTRTTKSSSKRRDSFTVQHTGHHGHGILHHNLPSPPPAPSSPATNGSGSRPQAIVIPSQHHFGRNGVSVPAPNSPLGMMSMSASMNGMGIGNIGIGVGQTSGWFLPNTGPGTGPMGATPGSAPSAAGAEYSLPTPDSVSRGHAFGQFGTSVGSMGISPKDTTLGAKGESPPIEAALKQAQLVNEKRRRRRESHNAVERRRRDNINEKISELATLIPEVMLNPSAPSTSLNATSEEAEQSSKKEGSVNPGASTASNEDSASNAGEAKDGGPVKANKGMILRKSVEYIRYLQQLVNAQAARNRELEQRLARAGIQDEDGKDGSSSQLNGDLSQLTGSDASSDLSRALSAAGVSSFPDDVLNLHTFGTDNDDVNSYMGMGFGSFDGSGAMEMDGDVTMGADGSYQVRRGGEQEGTSPSAASEEDAVSPRDDDEQQQPRMMMREKEVELEMEARGRRDREGRVRTLGMPGVVTVKEEAHMEL